MGRPKGARNKSGIRIRRRVAVTHKDAYRDYPPGFNMKDPLYCDSKTYVTVCREFNKLFSKEIMETGYKYKLPYFFGDISITKCKLPSLYGRSVDRVLSKEYKKTIYHNNEHSFGFYARWKWKKGNLPNGSVFKFIPSRRNKRALAKLIKEDNQINKYIQF